jgi:deoxyadenosine/deoxycytidine kinase
MESSQPRIISVEGNIGAGKSTLVEKLKTHYENRDDVIFLQEPVDVWSTITQEGKTMLELFYEDKKKYSFAFQILAYSTRLKILEEAILDAKSKNVKLIVMERSLDADRNIFAKMLYDEGMMEECMYQIYLKMSDEGLQKYMADGILWLHAGPEICLERIKKRGREGEEFIPIEYLRSCDTYHREWLGADTGFVYLVGDDVDWESLETYLFRNT